MLAVRFTAVAELTALTVAVKLAVVAPDATVTDGGTLTAALLLVRLTAKPPLAAAVFRVTVQLSVPAPVIALLVQLNPLSTGVPVPLRLTDVEVPVDELLVNVNSPVAAPAAVGSNCTVRVAVWPAVSVSGKVAPEIENPAPETVAELMVNDADPVDDRISAWVRGEFTASLPNERLELLTLKIGVVAPS